MSTLYSTNHRLKGMFTNILSFLIILAITFPTRSVAAALGPCSDPLGCVIIGPQQPIHIAYALTLSGPYSSLGIDARNGIEIAIEDSGGKILGHNIQFDGADDACSAGGGATAGAALADDPTVVVVIGTSCSLAARTAIPILAGAGLAMISPSNTAPDLTEAGNPNNYAGYLRVSWNDITQAVAAARFARKHLKLSTAATFNDGSIYSTYLEQTFAEEFTNLGGTITAQVAISPGQTDMSAALTAAAAGSPGILYFPVFMPAGAYLINQARATASLKNSYLMGSDALWTYEVVKNTGKNAEGFMVTNIDLTKNSPAYTSHFLPAYKAKFGTAPISTFHAHAYDAFMIIKTAIEKVALVDTDGTIQIGRQALRNSLYGTTEFAGLTGILTCTTTGDCANPYTGVYKYHAGLFPPEKIWLQYPSPAPYTESFTDVSTLHPYFVDIEILYANGLTGGCGTNPLRFCPDQVMDRGQAAVFMVRGTYGAGFSPNPMAYKFKDDWSKALYARPWAEAMREANLTTGCKSSPLLYCPLTKLNREQAVIFGLKMKYGMYYLPPPATGTVFADMTNPSYWATPWAEKAYADGLITACGSASNGKPKFCPGVLVTRGLGAYIIVRAKNLSMP